ncbi:MAG: hypothetical protein Q8M98_11740 [Candidatus Cloacimonadaceae bacterium]|nr:hypothetical protein [Candidatus Cloacimonadaceae bacterium]
MTKAHQDWIPAFAGMTKAHQDWIPAFAGMTKAHKTGFTPSRE